MVDEKNRCPVCKQPIKCGKCGKVLKPPYVMGRWGCYCNFECERKHIVRDERDLIDPTPRPSTSDPPTKKEADSNDRP